MTLCLFRCRLRPRDVKMFRDFGWIKPIESVKTKSRNVGWLPKRAAERKQILRRTSS